MKINNKILHIPPYISTVWNQVQFLYLQKSNLIVVLNNNIHVEIPDLEMEIIERIFDVHAQIVENITIPAKELPVSHQPLHSFTPFSSKGNKTVEMLNDSTLAFGFGGMDALGSALHHNASQSNMPDLPSEILSKISAIAKIVAPEDVSTLPMAEPHCNCPHCQIARAVQQGVNVEASLDQEISDSSMQSALAEEEVCDEDLTFQQWSIQQKGELLFSVFNRLDPEEKYSVHLGNPVGCTCGKEGCEHILAVLKS